VPGSRHEPLNDRSTRSRRAPNSHGSFDLRKPTELSAEIAEGDGITLMTTDELVKQSFASFKTGKLEIRPGQSNQLALMRRFAPDFINRQLWKASKKLVPVGVR